VQPETTWYPPFISPSPLPFTVEGHARSVLPTIRQYNDGKCSFQDILSFVESYHGRETHLLWQAYGSQGRLLIDCCFDDVADGTLLEILQALVW
jgi:hypothetical protein